MDTPEYFLDSSIFHTYRIEGRGDSFLIFVDDQLANDYVDRPDIWRGYSREMGFGDYHGVGHSVSEWDYFA
jgi:hypothetical protein